MITEQESVWYASQLVLALQFLHSKKVVYRDLKPENIMVKKNGYLKLIDFGLGKKLKEDRTFTLCGTPQYMAPEALDQKGYGTSVDFWSLGILVYEMLTGQTPFDAEDPFQVFQNIRKNEIKYPRWLKSSSKSFLR